MFDFGAAPAIDRLIVVSHNAQIAVILCQGLHNSVLAAVRVLVFVDQQVVEQRSFFAPHVREVREQLFGQQQQIVKVNYSTLSQRLLITSIRHRREMLLVGTRDCCCVGGANALCLPLADKTEQVARTKRLAGHVDVAKHSSREALLIASVVDREPGRITEMVNLTTQNANAM